MAITTKKDTAHTLDQARDLLADRAKEILSPHSAESLISAGRAVVRVSVAVADFSPLAWLAAQKHPVKTYWADREGDFEAAGVGEADVVSSDDPADYQVSLEQLGELLASADDDTLRYYGGLRFDAGNTAGADSPWRPFGTCRFVLPRFELIRCGDGTALVCNVIPDRDSTGLDQLLGGLQGIGGVCSELESALPDIEDQTDVPVQAQWTAMVKDALGRIARAEVQKVVLARKVAARFADTVPPMVLLTRLKRQVSHCTVFAYQLDDRLAFVGASPERLYRRDGRAIVTEAIGGTRSRGSDSDSDRMLETDLVTSPKDLREHQYVRDAVSLSLEGLCRSVALPGQTSVLKLTDVQHIITTFRGELLPGVTDADILRALHPTPAVGGHPAEAALGVINRTEPFDRGWYAGPIGWLSRDEAEFAVGIRSGLVQGSTLCLFAGAGIVAGSSAEKEWHETESKLGSFIKALTC